MIARSLSFFVPGTPIAKQSFRVGNGHGYQRPQVKAWQDAVAWAAKEALAGRPMLAGDVMLELRFFLPTRRRVDCDNLCKGTADALRGIMYEDDAQIVDLHVVKVVDRSRPGVQVWAGLALGGGL